jgi:Xaa-Pro aminopeptidase
MRYEPITSEIFRENRKRLAEMMPKNSLAVVNANDLLPTNSDGIQDTIVNSDIFYLSGVEQEQSILLIFPDADDPKQREILFLREPSELNQIWEGHKLSKKEARQLTGITSIHWLEEFPMIFHALMCECEGVVLNSNEHPRAEVDVESRDARFIANTMRRYPIHRYFRLARLLNQLRAVKSEAEIKLMGKACDLTGQAFRRVLEFTRPGRREYEVEAEFAHEFISNGSRFAYRPIIGSGINACCLHYLTNSETCKNGDLLLLDVGASYANYNADMTRTIPVNGRFSPRQKQVYNSVLKVMRQSIAGLVPGKKMREWNREAGEMIERELVELGLISMDDIRNQDPDWPAYKKYFMHGLGHPLGLDVHDVALMAEPMRAGYVMTVEPGIYIPEEGFAVRLENDVVITEDGTLDLMAGVPVEADEIEEIMNA